MPVGSVRGGAAGVADPRAEHPRQVADEFLEPPEASAGEDRALVSHQIPALCSNSPMYWP
ncbi:hypothetical protein ACFPRL_13810 [Pseudoclavibacter helvolus]